MTTTTTDRFSGTPSASSTDRRTVRAVSLSGYFRSLYFGSSSFQADTFIGDTIATAASPSMTDRFSGSPLLYSQGLEYSYYSHSDTYPTTETEMDALFAAATLLATGIHTDAINWSNDGAIGPGGATGASPSYVSGEQFAWLVEGYLLAPSTGTFNFGVNGNDAVDVHVNGVNVANFYGPHGVTTTVNTTDGQSLIGGMYYNFRARMQEVGGEEGIQVVWQKPGDAGYSVIPAANFWYPANSGITDRY